MLEGYSWKNTKIEDGETMSNFEELFPGLVGKTRCPFCNINDTPSIDEDEWPDEYKEGFRFVCVSCEKCYVEPVVDIGDIMKFCVDKEAHEKEIDELYDDKTMEAYE